MVSGAIDPRRLQTAQAAAQHLNEIHPDGGWERTRNELWREVRYCRHAAFLAIASTVRDPLALEIMETAPPIDFVQFASMTQGFATKGGIGRNFHIDGGTERAPGVFNFLLGVALTGGRGACGIGGLLSPGLNAWKLAAFPAHRPRTDLPDYIKAGWRRLFKEDLGQGLPLGQPPSGPD